MSTNDFFQTRFNKLNEAQKQAVLHIWGPIMVLAGPGTGKTEILAARIANILNTPETMADPQNILCLTYTEAGTIAMRKRLLQFIGPDAHKVGIYTFHAFCNEVIQANLDYFGKRDLQVVADLEKINIIESIVESFASDNPLFKKSGYYEVSRLKSLFEIMKAENWTNETITAAIKKYLADLPNREDFLYKRKTGDFNKGDLNERKFNIELEKMIKLQAGANEFINYQSKLAQINRYDYQDMILWVIKAFKENNNILATYQEQYQYILVDEYQDTNGAQSELLDLLSNFWEDPNILVVGDDDQSIYRFQGANVKNMLHFYHKYPNLTNIVLTNNYRSSQLILNTAHYLICNNTERLTSHLPVLNKKLFSANPLLQNSSTEINLNEYETNLQEEIGIVKKIKDLQAENLDLSEIAIIYKEHKQAENIIKMLNYAKIPFNIKKAINILDLPFTKQLIDVLTYLNQETKQIYSGEYLLFAIMHYEFLNINLKDINLIAVAIQQQKLLIKEDKKQWYWRDFISNEEELNKLPLAKTEQIINFVTKLQLLEKAVFNCTLQDLFEKIINELSVINYVLTNNNSLDLMQVLHTFFNFIKAESMRAPNITLKQFLQTLEQMKVHNLALNINKITLATNGVNLITAHSAKGLEFSQVFLLGTNKKKWDNSNQNKEFSFPDTLTLSNAGDELEEARRLFFVALTRAKTHLYISYAIKDEQDREQEASQFIDEISKDTDLNINKVRINENDLLQFGLATITTLPTNNSLILEPAYLDDLLANYRLNVTHLNKYLKCPVAFYFENLLKIPAAQNEFMSFGSAIHYALEQFFKKSLLEGKIVDKKDLIYFFTKGMNLYKFAFTETQFSRNLDYGQDILNGFCDKYKDNWVLPVKLEYYVNDAQIAGVPLTGKIDKIEFMDQQVNVVDYKTGKFSYKTKEKLCRPKDITDIGGDYWRQIVFYKILLDNSRKQNWQMQSGEIDFVEKDDDQVYHKEQIIVTSEDEAIVIEQIRSTYAKIKNHEFNHGCGEKDCQWCEWQKRYYDN